jgi:hypothetical protein
MRQIKPNSSSLQEKIDISESFSKLKVKDGRLLFKSRKEFVNLIELLADIKRTPIEIDSIRKNLSIKPFKNWNDSTERITLEEGVFIPNFVACLLNEEGEYQIGDTIVAFYKGYQVFLLERNVSSLDKIKANITNPPKGSVLEIHKLYKNDTGESISNGRTESGSISLNQVINRICYFSTNINYKIVFELWNAGAYVGSGQYQMFLRTQIKVEYFHSNSGTWKNAGEYSEKFIFNFTASFGNGVNVYRTYSNASWSLAGNYTLQQELAASYSSESKWYINQMQGQYLTKVYPFYQNQTGNGCGSGYYSEFIYWF